ncbi:armadillo-type protein [Mycena vulgaris]|nr:armadillo-type protein [Mycena vulgaris]
MPPVAHQQTLTQGSTISPPLTILPLARQQSRGSTSSWWSDSNPGLQGPTINLHAAAKPLMKIMYHRQALGLMKTNNSKQLSRETADIYSTYLLCKYVSTATKVTVLKGLQRKAGEESNACTVVDSGVLHCVPELLKSPDSAVRGQICWLLGRLAYYEATLPKILVLNPCTQLVSLLRDENLEVIKGAAYALGEVSLWPEGAQAAVDAKVLDYTATLLGWSEHEILGQLAMHTFTVPAALELGLCGQLVSLFRDKNLEVIEGAAYALSKISLWPDGAQAATDAKVLDHVAELLQSQNVWTLRRTCELVGHLVSHESTVLPSLAATPWMWLLPSLHSDTDFVRTAAAFALAKTSQQPDGVAALADTGILDDLETLNQSSEDGTQVYASRIRKNLARYKARRRPKESFSVALSQRTLYDHTTT